MCQPPVMISSQYLFYVQELQIQVTHTHTNIIICLISFHILFTLLGSITQHFQYFDVITYFMNNVQHTILTVHQKHLCLVLITTP